MSDSIQKVIDDYRDQIQERYEERFVQDAAMSRGWNGLSYEFPWYLSCSSIETIKDFLHEHTYAEMLKARGSNLSGLKPVRFVYLVHTINPGDFENVMDGLVADFMGDKEKAEEIKNRIRREDKLRKLGVTGIILASKSPRREELLKKLCTDFKILSCDADEIQSADNPCELAIKNATIKAETVAQEYPNAMVIGADTIVALNGEIFGKPCGEDGAFVMLKRLSGKRHEVITGLAICAAGKTYTAAETTEVFFGEMTDAEIRAYVQTGEPLDKSGSYALQGGAAKFIKKIHGDWSNVVGLPLYRLRMLAKSVGIDFNSPTF